MARFVRVVDGRPRLLVGAILTSGVAGVLLGAVLGVVDVLTLFGDGIVSTLARIDRFFTGDVIGRLFRLAADSIEIAWAEAIAFNAGIFPPLAWPLAVAETIVVTYVLILGLRALTRGVTSP